MSLVVRVGCVLFCISTEPRDENQEGRNDLGLEGFWNNHHSPQLLQPFPLKEINRLFFLTLFLKHCCTGSLSACACTNTYTHTHTFLNHCWYLTKLLLGSNCNGCCRQNRCLFFFLLPRLLTSLFRGAIILPFTMSHLSIQSDSLLDTLVAAPSEIEDSRVTPLTCTIYMQQEMTDNKEDFFLNVCATRSFFLQRWKLEEVQPSPPHPPTRNGCCQLKGCYFDGQCNRMIREVDCLISARDGGVVKVLLPPILDAISTVIEKRLLSACKALHFFSKRDSCYLPIASGGRDKNRIFFFTNLHEKRRGGKKECVLWTYGKMFC